MLNPGLLDRIAIALQAALIPGWGLLSPGVMWVLSVTTTLYLIATLTFAMAGMLDVIPAMGRALAKHVMFVWVLTHFHAMGDLLINVFAGLGLLFSPTGMTAAEFALPGRVLWQGQDLLWPLIDYVNKLSWLDYAKNFADIQIMVCAMWLSWIAFFLFALHMLYVQITCQLALLLNFPKIALGIYSGTAFIAQEGLESILRQLFRLVVVALLVGVSTPWLQWLAFPEGQKPDFWSASAMVAGSWVITTLSLVGPRALEAHGGSLITAVAGAAYGLARGGAWIRRNT
jgi:type IV secretory pathway TrbL component